MQEIKETIIYSYRVRKGSDSGLAPCIYDLKGKPTDLLTLVCCKGGKIYHEGKPNEKGSNTGLRYEIGKKYKDKINAGSADVYLLGIYDDELLYFAKITGILSMTDYFASDSPYKKRQDDIYDVIPAGFRPKKNNPHKTPQQKRDWLGEFALISDCFAYWGKESAAIPQNLLDILPQYREPKHYQPDTNDYNIIMDFVKNLWNFKDNIKGKPHNYAQDCNSKSRKKCIIC